MYLLLLFLLHFFHADPPIVVARDTTYITEPLRPDGLPDYEKYVLELDRKGATPDNNAAVLLFQSLWLCGLDPEDYKMVCAELGLKEIPSAKAALEPLYGDANKKRVAAWRLKQHLSAEDPDLETIDPAVDHPWTSQQFPPLAEWVNANKRPLDLLVEASRRPRFYSPSPTLLNGQHDTLIAMLLPGPQAMREAGRDLSVRAMWHVGERRLNEAWTDLMAVHRLARLTAQDHTIVEQLVAMAISEIACRGTVALLGSEQMTDKLANQIHKDLAGLPNVSNVNDSFNNMERLSALDSTLYMKLHGVETFSGEPRRGPDVTNAMSIDWNVTLRRVNYWYDRLFAITQLPTRKARKKAYAKFEADVSEDGQRVKQPIEVLVAFFSLHKRSEMVGGIIACLLTPALDAAAAGEERTKTTFELARIAAAIGVFRAEHRSYPAKLDDLVPTLLKKVPIDLYNSKPFIYKRTEDGYLLYSCGDNGVDDGGSHELWNVLAGPWLEGPDNSRPQQPQPGIPTGADDMSIRVPRPTFKLPNAGKTAR